MAEHQQRFKDGGRSRERLQIQSFIRPNSLLSLFIQLVLCVFIRFRSLVRVTKVVVRLLGLIDTKRFGVGGSLRRRAAPGGALTAARVRFHYVVKALDEYLLL